MAVRNSRSAPSQSKSKIHETILPVGAGSQKVAMQFVIPSKLPFAQRGIWARRIVPVHERRASSFKLHHDRPENDIELGRRFWNIGTAVPHFSRPPCNLQPETRNCLYVRAQDPLYPGSQIADPN